MLDFIRLVEGPLVGLVIFLVLVFGVSAYLRHNLDAEERVAVVRVRNFLVLVSVVVFLIYAVNAASVNTAPRGQLDRSIVNERAKDLDNQVHQPAQPEVPKQEGDRK